MSCVICKTGKTFEGKVTVVLEREKSIIIIKEVPAMVCDNCSEYYLSEEVAKKVYLMAEESVKHHAEVEIFRYAA